MNTDADEKADQHQVERRRRRYLVAPTPARLLGPAVPPVAADVLFEEIKVLPRARFHRVLRRAEGSPGAPPPAMAFPPVAVVELPDEQARALSQIPGVVVEPDRALSHLRATPVLNRSGESPPVVSAGPESRLTFLVQGRDGGALPGASVLVVGGNWPTQGVTGPDGRVTLTVFTEDVNAIEGVCVKPAHGYWDRWIDHPYLTADGDNLITVRRLDEIIADFPHQQSLGWGQRAMRLAEVPPTFRGAGARIAIIDSGVAADHPDLKGQINAGVDLVEPGAAAWSVDVVGHGTHCAGVIAGVDNGAGILGFAGDAEIHSCRIFPGGRFSDLIETLDYCVEAEIDVVNLSIGARGGSLLVSQKITQAREAGVACVAAAGSTGDGVHFPASLPTVLTVAAIGQLATFPADSYHATQLAGPPDARGFFSPRFTCAGPEVDVCAPGVAIVSAVPRGDYAAWDGTSAAAPHVTGLAALVLAHRAEFSGPFARRDAARVRRLFEVITSTCQPVADAAPDRCGAGLPDAPAALGLAPIVTGQVPTMTGPPVPPDVNALLVLLRAAAERAGLVPARLA
jgi:subtilisin family serine protease